MAILEKIVKRGVHVQMMLNVRMLWAHACITVQRV